MADLKISQLTGATTPLAGTEVLPLVQSSTTKKVAVSDLTTGRTVDMAGLLIGTTALGARVASIRGRVAFVAPANDSQLAIYSDGVTNGLYSTYNATGSYLPMSFYTADTKKAELSTGGDLTLNTGNLVIGTSGKGIDFSATPGTGTSELLADYEEGTWTGTLTAATPPTVAVTATGNYTKIGRQVTVNIQFSNVSTVGAVGTLQITGLPFTPSFDALGACGKVAQSINVDSSYVANGNTSIRLVTQDGLAYEAIIAVVGVYLWVSISYFV